MQIYLKLEILFAPIAFRHDFIGFLVPTVLMNQVISPQFIKYIKLEHRLLNLAIKKLCLEAVHIYMGELICLTNVCR